MAEQTRTLEQTRNKEGQLVVPLDDVRVYDFNSVVFTSGTHTSGYIVASGKVAYISELLITELSGTEGRVWLTDEAGARITPPIGVTENTTISWDPNEVCGPIQSGIRIYNETLWGRATLVVIIDPQAIE